MTEESLKASLTFSKPSLLPRTFLPSMLPRTFTRDKPSRKWRLVEKLNDKIKLMQQSGYFANAIERYIHRRANEQRCHHQRLSAYRVSWCRSLPSR